MPYNKTMTWAEIEQASENIAYKLYDAIRQAERFYDKVVSWADGDNDATIAARYSVNDIPFADLAELEVAIGEVRSLATTLNTITGAITSGQIDDLEVFV